MERKLILEFLIPAQALGVRVGNDSALKNINIGVIGRCLSMEDGPHTVGEEKWSEIQRMQRIFHAVSNMRMNVWMRMYDDGKVECELQNKEITFGEV